MAGRQEADAVAGLGKGIARVLETVVALVNGLRRKERWFRLLFRPRGCSEAPAFDSDGTRNGGIVREVG